MFRKILLVHKDNLSEKAREVFEKVRRLLKKKDLSINSYSSLKYKDVQNKDLIITLGGDGTFLRAANLIESSPILGINPEPKFSEGVLTSINGDELENLKEILEGKYKTIKRQRIKTRLNKNILNEKALNEVYIGTKFQFYSSRYIIIFKGNEEEQRSSGVIIATGTGSTAWYKSAGGTPFHYGEEKLKFLVREPYFGKIFKPELLNGELFSKDKIIFKSTREFGGILAIDYTEYNLNKGDIIEIELSNQPLNVLVKAE